MAALAELKSTGAHKTGEALKIPTLTAIGAAPLIRANPIDKLSANYKAGYAEGAAECAERLEAERAHLATIGAGLKNALRDIDERCRNDCAALIEQLFAALAPSIARLSTLAEINAIIQKNTVRKKQPVTIRIHPELADDLALGDAEDVSDAAKISIETDGQLNPNAVDISWTSGGMFYDPDAVITDILRILGEKENPNEE